MPPKRIEFPCAVCEKTCRTNTIQCEKGCGLWIHQKCIPMSDVELNKFSKSTSYFVCLKYACTTDKQTKKVHFNLIGSLTRLEEASTIACSISERGLLQFYSAEPIPNNNPKTILGTEDAISLNIIRRFHGVMLSSMSPRAVVGDGNFLYRAASLALFETQEYHVYLRLISAMELIENTDFYDKKPSSVILELLESPLTNYDTIVSDAVKLGTTSYMAHIYALSAATGFIIQSYMPPTCAIEMRNPYTRLVVGRNILNSGKARFTLMWTQCSEPELPEDFEPNHFVYLASKLHTVKKRISNQIEDTSFPILSDSGSELQTESDSETEEENIIQAPTIVQATIGLYPLPSNILLDTRTVLELLHHQSDNVTVVDRIPHGKKENVYCLLRRNATAVCNDNSYNLIDDDCGVWNSKNYRTNKYAYVISDGCVGRRLFLKAGKYCKEVLSEQKRHYIPFNPQPNPSRVVTIERTYCTLAASDLYRRRVTYLKENSQTDCTLTVVEYIGKHVTGQKHGNTKNQNANPYVRTPVTTSIAISKMLRNKPVHEVYNTLKSSLNIEDAPRDSNVIRRQKTSDRKKEKKSGQLIHNFADEYQAVFNMVQSNSFVRKFDCDSQRTPSVILYNDRQINEIKNFCFNGVSGSVLSFDKTYNLGNIYATPCVYKNLVLQRRRKDRSGDSPLFIGPIFVHGHSDLDTFGQFFSHLCLRFRESNSSKLILGSDEELALRCAMDLYFPRSGRLLCSRHLRQNAMEKLNRVTGTHTALRKSIAEGIFSDTGLMSCRSTIEFDEDVDRLRENVLATCPEEFSSYFNTRLVANLRSNVVIGYPNWTNNNSESINHVLKSYTQWRVQQLPDLVEKLRLLVESQQIEADRSLCGRGDFELRPAYANHRLIIDIWKEMNDA